MCNPKIGRKPFSLKSDILLPSELSGRTRHTHTHIQTDIVTFRLNLPKAKGQLSEHRFVQLWPTLVTRLKCLPLHPFLLLTLSKAQTKVYFAKLDVQYCVSVL